MRYIIALHIVYYICTCHWILIFVYRGLDGRELTTQPWTTMWRFPMTRRRRRPWRICLYTVWRNNGWWHWLWCVACYFYWVLSWCCFHRAYVWHCAPLVIRYRLRFCVSFAFRVDVATKSVKNTHSGSNAGHGGLKRESCKRMRMGRGVIRKMLSTLTTYPWNRIWIYKTGNIKHKNNTRVL